MSDIYQRAARGHEAMRREALERRRIRREEERGQGVLFDPEELVAGTPDEAAPYQHEPPWPPYGSGSRRDQDEK